MQTLKSMSKANISPANAIENRDKKKLCKFKHLLKLLTTLVFLTCAVLALYQSAKSIMLYRENPITTTVTERELQDSEYPIILLCSAEFLKDMLTDRTAVEEQYFRMFHEPEQVPVEDMETYPWTTKSLQQFQDEIIYESLIFDLRLPGKDAPLEYTDNATLSYSSKNGMCLSYHPWRKARTLMVRIPGSRDLVYRLIKSVDEIHQVYINHMEANLFEELDTSKGKVAFRLDVKQTTKLAENGFICSKGKGYYQEKCYDMCVGKQLVKENVVNCSLPWIKSRLNAPDCNNYEDYHGHIKAIRELVHKNPYNTVCQKNCPKACTNFKYTMASDAAKLSEKTDNTTTVKITVDPTLRIVNEFAAYGFMNVVGDVGGIVGILLGFSLFGLYQMAVDFLRDRKMRKEDSK